MNICLISEEYPPEGNLGGIASYTETIAQYMANNGHRVNVIASTTKNERSYIDNSVNVHRIHGFPGKFLDKIRHPAYPHNALLNYSHRVLKTVDKILRRENIDIIEAPEFLAQAFIVFSKRSKIPSVTRLHTPSFFVRELNDTPSFDKYDDFERRQVLVSWGVTSPTKALADIIKNRWGIENIEVIPNFFDFGSYKPDESAYNKYFKDKEYILFYGRLEIRKGVHVLGKALGDIFLKYPNITMGFIGRDMSWEKFGSMKKYIQDLQKDFSGRLIFVGSLPHNSLYPIIKKSKLVVFPSLWENFPYACLEAMRFGKTVLATSGSGYNEIITDGTSGYLVEANNHKKLGEKIIKLLQKTPITIGENAKKTAKSFNSEIVAGNMVKYYKKISSYKN